jgi:hypothetical protein
MASVPRLQPDLQPTPSLRWRSCSLTVRGGFPEKFLKIGQASSTS